MPPVSEKQRRLMWYAASKKGGADGVSQKAAKEFTKVDPGGKLPEQKDTNNRRKVMYSRKNN